MTTTNNTSIEIAYQVAGSAWKRKTFKTEAAMDRFLDKLTERYGNCFEVRFAA